MHTEHNQVCLWILENHFSFEHDDKNPSTTQISEHITETSPNLCKRRYVVDTQLLSESKSKTLPKDIE